jgi:hypothetical protein
VGAGIVWLVVSLSGQASPAAPVQPEPATARAATSNRARWEAGLEYQRDRFDYRFENPSSYDAAEPVPHAFEQRYDADSLWFTGRVRFTLGARPLETEAGISVPATGVGSDYDTFDQPGGNVVVYGTTADTDAWSWRAAQYVGLGTWLGVRWRAAYSYRRDRADYRPSFTTVVQTKPPSSRAFWNTGRETAVSEVHEVRIGVEQVFAPAPGWHVGIVADAAPTTLARLTTILPDKYSTPVVFIAKGLSVNAAIHLGRRIGRWYAGAAVTYARAWSYSGSDAYHRRAVSAGIMVGR